MLTRRQAALLFVLTAAFCLTLTMFSPRTEANASAVEIVAPRHLSTVVGPTEIRVRVTPPAGVRPERLQILVDGAEIASLTGPPWQTTWDAGDASRGHNIHAILHLAGGGREHAGIRTSPLRINQVEDVDLVNLYVIVKTGNDYITDLSIDDFSLKEDGRVQRIARFSTERRPLAIGLVLDTSLTMEGGKLAAARESALSFLDALEPEDRGMIVAFSDRVRILHQLTPEKDKLAKAIKSVEAKGGTALYDAIWKTADNLRKLDGRRVLVLLSDGRDEAASGLEPGSLHTLQEALDHALRCEVMIFAIGFGKNLDRQFDFYERETLADILSRLGGRTGGRVMFPKRAGSLRKAFEMVALDLRHQYSIAYTSTNEERDGAWREINLNASDPRYRVVTRHGYYAPEESEEEGATARQNESRP